MGLPTIAYTQTYMDIDWAAVDAERDDGVSFSWAKLAQEGAPAAFGTFCVSPPSRSWARPRWLLWSSRAVAGGSLGSPAQSAVLAVRA